MITKLKVEHENVPELFFVDHQKRVNGQVANDFEMPNQLDIEFKFDDGSNYGHRFDFKGKTKNNVALALIELATKMMKD